MKLEEVRILCPEVVCETSFYCFKLPAAVELPGHGKLARGYWLLANTIAWLRESTTAMSRLLQRLKLEVGMFVSGAPVPVLKGEPLQLTGFPTKAPKLSFIHYSQLKTLVNSKVYWDHYERFGIASSALPLAHALLAWGNKLKGVAVVTCEPGKKKRGRPPLPIEQLKSPAYARRRTKRDLISPIAVSLNGAVQAAAHGPVAAAVEEAARTRALRKEVCMQLLVTDESARKVATDIIRDDERLSTRVFNGNLGIDLATGMAVPVWRALLMKDKTSLSDKKMRIIASGKSKYAVVDTLQFPRVHDIRVMRRITTLGVAIDLGLKDLVTDDMVHAACDLASVCRMQYYEAIAGGTYDVSPTTCHRWKLTFDGTDAGGKSLLVFGLIPLSLSAAVQSSTNVFPFGIAWVSESEQSLNSCIPNLTEQVAALEGTGGLPIQTPDGPRNVPIEFEVAADMSSLWKLTGIGSASADHSCCYCMATHASRQHIGDPISDLSVPANWRTDLKAIFGIPMKRVHPCTLHALTRVTEKLMRLLIIECIDVEARRASAKATAVNSLKLKRQVLQTAKALSKQARQRPQRVRAAEADVAAAEEALEAARNASLLATGSVEQLQTAMVSTKVLQKTYTVTITPKKKGDGCRVEISTLTGPQCRKLLGLNKEGGRADPPYLEVIEAALGRCTHDWENAVGVGEGEFCFRCNVVAVFRMWTWIYPFLAAVTDTALNTAAAAYLAAQGIAEEGKGDDLPPFNRDEYHALVQQWGQVLVHTFYGGGSTSIITDYCKCC